MADPGVAAEVSVSDLVLVPMKLDAFILNEAVSSGGEFEAKIAPITQPNYTFLRPEEFYIQNDILNQIDIHAASPASKNSRVTDLRTGLPRANRLGVYLHWTLPRLYRTAAVSKDAQVPKKDGQTPQLAPTRWLVVRHIVPGSFAPADAEINELDAWVIESDCKRDLNQDLTESDDMQVDVSPFVTAEPESGNGSISIREQAEVFIGKKTALADWDKDATGPRVQVSLFNSSNQLFPDYQPHNSNVFSMVDPLDYGDGKKLTSAKISYYVVGWHASSEDDPLCRVMATAAASTDKLGVLKALSLILKDQTTKGVTEWSSASASPTQVICHGAMYDVEWDASRKPTVVLADIFAKKLNDQIPVAIGETPIDALLAFVDAHKAIDTDKVQRLETSIDAIRLLLRAQDDGVESQRLAEDSLSSTHYMNEDGGVCYHLAVPSQEPSSKDGADSNDELSTLNDNQALLDAALRTRSDMQWNMFALWWRYLSDPNGPANAPQIKLNVGALMSQATALQGEIDRLNKSIDALKAQLPDVKPAAKPPFSRALDPTLLVGGVPTGWPHDFLQNTTVRLTGQTVQPASEAASKMPAVWSGLLDVVGSKLPTASTSTVDALLREFMFLDPAFGTAPSSSCTLPLYHDELPVKPDKSMSPWRDRWASTQPWFPLFMEWEAEYTHIPFDNWELQESTSSRSTVEKLSYQIKSSVDLSSAKIVDRRLVSGRTLILPQPTVSLRQIISQLFADTPVAVLNDYLSQDQQDEMKQELEAGFNSLAFLSTPLSGFVDHLTTRFQGSHVKPSATLPTGRQTMDDALQASKAGGFTAGSLNFIGDETALTPYGTLVNALKGSSMFKPATHGQFRMIKLNIVDKFGQVVHAINPSVPPNEAKPLYPCISERLRPQGKAANPLVANTVQEDKPGNCEFVQLPPRINQPARINAHFVDIVDGTGPGAGAIPRYQPLREDENPVWGWVVVNFPDSGLQLFQEDGTFYREIRFGGPKGTLVSDDWLPFGPPKDAADRAKSTKVAQLNGFIERLKDAHYLQGIVSMIEESSKNSPAAPNAYAETLASVIGKPLALVNVGWSLELAGDAYSNRSDFHTALPSDLSLIGGPQSSASGHYTFPIKIGDKNRLFDGTIGYFSPRPKGTATAGDFYNLDTLHTYYVSNPAGTGDPRSELTTASYPKLSPMWIPPFSNQPNSPAVDPSSYAATYARSLTVVGALIDPFCPINVYSGILPPKPLRMLPWVWQEAFRKMTAFFHLGPLVMTHEVPPYSAESKLTDRWDQVAPVASNVGLHTAQSVEWAWLQPYVVNQDAPPGSSAVSPVATTAFMPLAVDQVAPGVAFDKAPYTAIEGYLQMRRAIEKTS
ncbi:hypothetical protein B0T19DRAFT_38548 [Cercophora scortea]|uniref:Uncharacterized protein n=1 Tax=Cercophora scortea TaxID=314031 RepID=A0AAE0MLT5_9PEZI|nr:hypothetical protein B0T19DRAFT_38548 [Cercophora scortea]